MNSILLCTTAFLALAISNYSQSVPDFKALEKSFVPVNESLYVSKYEVANADYKIFLAYLNSNHDDAKLKICTPDSAKWNFSDHSNSMDPLVESYFSHPAFAEYPVVNISHQAAVLYCEWLTDEYNKNANRKYNEVKFRLPSTSEWNSVASQSVPDEKKAFIGNFKWKKEDNSKVGDYGRDGAMITAPVKDFSSGNGLCNFYGNVAEMTDEENTQLGGDWDTYWDDIKTNVTTKLIDVDPRVGFRVYMEIVRR